MATLGVMLLASINYNLSLGYGFTFLIADSGLAHILHSYEALLATGLALGRSTPGSIPPRRRCARLTPHRICRRRASSVAWARGEDMITEQTR